MRDYSYKFQRDLALLESQTLDVNVAEYILTRTSKMASYSSQTKGTAPGEGWLEAERLLEREAGLCVTFSYQISFSSAILSASWRALEDPEESGA